jgi:APA family basic amino acid/polyamine antiporter
MTAAHGAPEVLANAPHLLGLPIVFNLPAILAVLVVTAILCIGMRESATANAVLVAVKLIMIALFLYVGIGHVEPGNWTPFAPNGWDGIVTGAALIFFAYIGFDAVSTTAEEARNPQRDLPIGILASLLVCTVLYIAVTVVLTGMVPVSALANAEPVAAALRFVGADRVAAIISAGAVVSIASVLLVMQMAQTRIFFAMSRDGLLPRRFSKVHPRYGTPILPTLVTGGVVALSAGLIDISAAAELTNIGTLFAFILVSGGVWWLRISQPDLTRPFKVPFVGLVSVSAMASCFYLMLGLPRVTWERFGIWLVVGLVIYFLFGLRHSKLRAGIEVPSEASMSVPTTVKEPLSL